MGLLIKYDDKLGISYGYYRCPECDSQMYAGGPFSHGPSCSRAGEEDYEDLEYHIGLKVFQRLLNPGQGRPPRTRRSDRRSSAGRFPRDLRGRRARVVHSRM